MALFPLGVAYRLITNSICLLVILFYFFGCTHAKDSLPFYNTADFTAEWIAPSDPKYNKIHTIDNFQFTNQSGQLISNDSLRGHIYIANFFFTACPGICPKMISNMRSLQDSFLNDSRLKLLSFSVMPWMDSVKTLNKYGLAHHINPNKWYLLTGDKEQIYHLGRRSFFAEKKAGLENGTESFLHTESMLLVDGSSRIRGIYNATDPTQIKRVIEDIRILMAE